MMSRRTFMKTCGVGAAGIAVGSIPSIDAHGVPLTPEFVWLANLGKSLTTERDYRPRIEGSIPPGLRGRLFRNGPGLFDRNGYRKQHLLDGDGMIQCFEFLEDGVRYRNRFVRTRKFLEEEAAGELRYATWTTRAPGGVLANLGASMESQAGVTTLVRDGKLLALDEVTPFYLLDRETLQTNGTFAFPEGAKTGGCKAHTKSDSVTGDWILLGTDYGPTMTISFLIVDSLGRIKVQGTYDVPRMTYIHDFFATERYLVVLLHAVEFSPLGFLAGINSFMDSLTWKPEQGNLVMVLDKNAGAPVLLEAPAAFMWHSVNAYERGNEIVADFIGYDDPDHFIGENPLFKSIMRGEAGNALQPGKLRRYQIDPAARRLNETILDGGHHEFPVVDSRRSARQHRLGFMNRGNVGDWILDGVARIDFSTGSRDEYSFGPGHFVSEPIFAPNGSGEGDGWLLAQVQSRETGFNFLAIFDGRDVSAGPIARIHLSHHVPLSFHGYWDAAA